MLIATEELQQKHIKKAKEEKEKQALMNWVAEEFKLAAYFDESENDPTVFLKRLGRPRPVEEIEKKLKRLEPRLIFENHPTNPTKKIMYINRNGQKQKLMIYESGKMSETLGLIPERSWMQPVYKEVFTKDFFNPTKPFHLDRKDLPKYEIIPHEFDKNTGDVKKLGDVIFDDTALRPGMTRIRMGWNEKIRGYRTMLAILVSAGVLTIAQAESAFGPDDTPEWAALSGRREKTRPW
jgi:hypothetical protein